MKSSRRKFRSCRLERLEERSLLSATPAGDESLVNAYLHGTQQTSPTAPAVASSPSGDLVVVFSGEGSGDTSGIFARRLPLTGNPGAEFRANVTTDGDQVAPTVAVAENGDFVIAWAGQGAGDRSGVFARRFNAQGTPLSGEILVNSTVVGTQGQPAVAITPGGGFVVAWSGNGRGDTQGVFLRR